MKRILTVIALLSNVMQLSVPVYADSNESFRLYQQVMSGQKKLESLSPEQQRQVIMIHGIMSRSSCDGCSDECRDARDQAEGYKDDLERYTKRLYTCVEENDFNR